MTCFSKLNRTPSLAGPVFPKQKFPRSRWHASAMYAPIRVQPETKCLGQSQPIRLAPCLAHLKASICCNECFFCFGVKGNLPLVHKFVSGDICANGRKGTRIEPDQLEGIPSVDSRNYRLVKEQKPFSEGLLLLACNDLNVSHNQRREK